MNCAEARRLLDQGLAPGSATPDQARLGFHLAGCPACRAYRAGLQQDLLASLLMAEDKRQSAARRQAPAPPLSSAPPPPRQWGARIGRGLWYLGLASLAAIVLGVAITVGWAAITVARTHQNVQAMIVATSSPEAPSAVPTATAVPTPAPPLPSATPSATPRPTSVPATPTPAAPPAGEPVTVLLLGSDGRPGETDVPRTDSIIIARIDPLRRRVALLSLPRDLWVAIPGYGYSRINAAHAWGGVELARTTVANLLGIPIDNTILIDFQGFIGAIDSLGGVTVDVEKELYDAQFPTMDYGYTVAHFLPGPQQMDGATALMYSRIRHPDSDFARMRRQQAVLVGVLAVLRGQNVLQSLKSLENVTGALRDYVRTDLPEDRMIGLAWALRDVTPEQIERYTLDENMISFGVGDDRWAEVVQPGAIDQLVARLLGQ